ncbi:hypothetical protein KHO57_gp075 [Mycobacterium phage Phabba]|uniref:Uncharacterized protein n=1 Tax=Mycobacterium phage Phabba TaxID=2027899 RepID=A0A249XSL7_9CAUD|nr:hypothetical protein KHO57_gp075 [Mycobacterium phage Phabba]ASZ74650.1 hypothetical protein SEA_PHABBA_75 [Mycobacterium phage Phabba]
MRNISVAVYGNKVQGQFDDRTAIMSLVGQFEVPNVGSSLAALEFVAGQINNRTSAKFVEPTRHALGRDLRAGDVITLDSQDYMITQTVGGLRFEEYTG